MPRKYAALLASYRANRARTPLNGLLQDHRISLLGVGGDLVEVEVAVSICRSGIERLGVLQVLRHSRDLAEDGGNGGQLR